LRAAMGRGPEAGHAKGVRRRRNPAPPNTGGFIRVRGRGVERTRRLSRPVSLRGALSPWERAGVRVSGSSRVRARQTQPGACYTLTLTLSRGERGRHTAGLPARAD
jgi:hypothetical protein